MVAVSAVGATQNATAQAPSVITTPATSVAVNGAYIHGVVSPNGDATAYWFQWGTDSNYGYDTGPVDAGSSTGVVFASSDLFGLPFGIVYHYRVAASNSFGTSYGADQTFGVGNKVKVWGSMSLSPTNLNEVVTVAAALDYSLALRSDGTVAAWGNNSAGVLTVPDGLNGVVALAAGGNHVLALKANGTVVAWGANLFNQTDVPEGLNNVMAVAAGANHSVALKKDGTVVTWGNPVFGLTSAATTLQNVAAISAGGDHCLALRVDGTVFGWGGNANGESTIPSDLSNVVAIASGQFHNVALRQDGTVAAWGFNAFQQATVPEGLTGVVAIYAGAFHCVALKSDATITGWGRGELGQTNPPPSLGNLVGMAAGTGHNVAVGLDFRPTAYPVTLLGPADNDLVITLSGSDPRNFPIRFRVIELPQRGELYQSSGGSRGAQITFPGSFVTDPGGSVIFAPAAGTTASPYTTFQYVVTDNIFTSDGAQVTVHIGSEIGPRISTFVQETNGFRIGFNATGTNYAVWGSTNFVDWTVLGAPTSPSSGYFEFLDPDANARRFYKIHVP